MLKLSKLADYAVVILVRLGQQDGVMASGMLSQVTGVREPTVAKILKILAARGIVQSQRGARGGYHLARPLGDISVARVISAMDGPIKLTGCVDGHDCEASTLCGLCGNWDPVNLAIREALDRISLADMARNGHPASGRACSEPAPLPTPAL
ncbi:SUF system Fe-S cluster assembly regulator [Ameyamaea chiangmaiensis]|uniref:SUF system Fe-S cluster assembly regulator n=1 Tax=Ameyamaea chiangmaiensis TaxID=442969 RepID=A0A850P968_9PROT|nr:SUF system Fe-S cluster assembly regulator [Ameyamaea chiangmaiensis]MBS4074519.1 SUF system Fe-S cluster assembly regulator [Ameyamaea chiangmaiensis]NVN41155.1 SUF system Fe-S cluster assembly regulator [Ameyamaea chiangmaiensis]